MIDFEKARLKMVDCQVRTVDVTEHRLLSAMLEVPRDAFVPKELQSFAYSDEELEVSKGRYLMDAANFGRLAQLAEIGEDDFALVIGTASGYEAAVLSLVASSVVALEEDEELATAAGERLAELGFDTATVVTGAHAGGYAKEAPYDVILLNGAVEQFDEALLDQLAEGGRLVMVEGIGNAADAYIYKKYKGTISRRWAFNCAVQPVPGFEKKAEFVF